MNIMIVDVLILAIIGVLLAASIFYMVQRKKKGGSSCGCGCGGCRGCGSYGEDQE
ncbi:MAG: FeoB-associated Cys-rich membrane protein [Lachnospiraceae bacterium]|nr:FeoB-associated Cys-rich membrane protein [Lachnospiraceae bacterium]MCI8996123.1 FeoB-associated Cys-rich membrane protein [Lachnospiraceae bacterium]MCI9134295.1 FeoB-associated Cys-rich membrane protein [Lachnospiraceae bacterium]